MPLAHALTNPRADRVNAIRSLERAAARRRHSRILVEGPQSVREAVRHVASRVRDVYLTEHARERWPEIEQDALAAGLYVHPTDDAVMTRMSADAQGVLAVLDEDAPTLAQALTSLESLAATAAPRLVAVCEHLSDPGNAGTIIRAADAVGADLVVLTEGSVDVSSPKVIRSTAGSLFHLPVVRGGSLIEILATLRERGLTILAADGAGEGDIETTDALHRPSAWVFGTEAAGLSEQAREHADLVLAVPMRGNAESLNVAMAATLCLYASSRAQMRDQAQPSPGATA